MAISNIWVFAEEAAGAPTSATLELLTKARGLGGTVTAFVGGDASAIVSRSVLPGPQELPDQGRPCHQRPG